MTYNLNRVWSNSVYMTLAEIMLSQNTLHGGFSVISEHHRINNDENTAKASNYYDTRGIDCPNDFRCDDILIGSHCPG